MTLIYKHTINFSFQFTKLWYQNKVSIACIAFVDTQNEPSFLQTILYSKYYTNNHLQTTTMQLAVLLLNGVKTIQ